MAIRIPAAIIVDHQTQEAALVAETGYEELLDMMEAGHSLSSTANISALEPARGT